MLFKTLFLFAFERSKSTKSEDYTKQLSYEKDDTVIFESNLLWKHP